MEGTWWTHPNELDEQQKEVISLPLTGDHLVVGPPGSGKTNLLILRATYLYRAKIRDTVILTFGRVLREFLVSGTENYPFNDRKVQTYIRWGASALEQHGKKLDENGDFEVVRSRLTSALREIVDIGEVASRHECILIDEAQDYSSEEIEIIRHFTKQIFAVGDNRQRIYAATGAIPTLEAFCQKSELKFHYRNGTQICKVADAIMEMTDDPDGLEASSQYDELEYPSSVKVHAGLPVSAQVARAIPEIETQLRAYPSGVIGVLCPRHAELDEVCELLESSALADVLQAQRYSEGYTAMDRRRRVVATTLHSAKGLEFRAVHLLGMDMVQKFHGAQKRLSFTAVTRAKTSLAIYHDADLPGHLERGLAALEPDGDLPELDDLFGGGDE